MAREDYEIVACGAVGLPHPLTLGPENPGPFLRLGELDVLHSPTILSAMVERRMVHVLTKCEEWRQQGRIDKYEALQIASKCGALDFERYCFIAPKGPRLSQEYRKLQQDNINETLMLGATPNPRYGNDMNESFAQAQRRVERQSRQWQRQKLAVKSAEDRLDAFQEFVGAAALQLIEANDWDGLTPDMGGYLRYLKRQEVFWSLLEDFSVPALLPNSDRLAHTYITGGSGSGKSELLKALIYCSCDMPEPNGVVVLDPHGDLAEQVARWREFEGSDRLVYVEPNLIEGACPTINPFDVEDLPERLKDVVAQEIIIALEQLMKGESGGDLSVNMRAILAPCVQVLIDMPNATLAHLQAFMDGTNNKELVALGRQHKRPAIQEFFHNGSTGFTGTHFERTKAAIAARIQYLRSTAVFDELLNGPSSVDLEGLVSQGHVVVFNLAKGQIGADASEAVGRFVLAKLQAMALRRQSLPRDQRRPVHCFVDECQNFISPATVSIMEEARKYGLHLTLAQQVAGRGMPAEMLKVVLNNTNVKFAGRTKDDAVMARVMNVDAQTLASMDPGQFICRSGSRAPFTLNVVKNLLGENNSMDDAAWQAQRPRMAPHYRPTDIPPSPSPGQTAQGYQQRELV